MEIAKHECKCKFCGETIHQGERINKLTYHQICGPDVTYYFHPKCFVIVKKRVHEWTEFYRWKRKNQRKLDLKYKVKQILRRLR